jgi:hypothetical protein
MKLIEKYAFHKLHKMAAAVNRRVKLPDPGSVRKVGVLWQPGQSAAFQYLHDHFSKSGVIFRNLCVYTRKTEDETGYNSITPGDLNWLGFPRSRSSGDFVETEFDLLLNIALEQNLVLNYLTSLSRAHFKIGWSPDEKNFFDLNINIKGKEDALFLAKQQIFYLRQLNEKKHVLTNPDGEV